MQVSLAGKNGHEVNGDIAEPAGTGRVGTIVLLQEWWGVNDHMRSLAKRASEAGFLVLVPDLYHGKVAKDAAEAKQLSSDLDTMHAVDDIRTAVTFAKAHERSNGNVGVMGFCLGGALTLAAACHVEGLSACVAFYGIPQEDKVDYAKVTAPIQFHVGKKDHWVTPERAEAVKAKLEAAGKSIELHLYDADHAFVNDTRSDVYSAENAKLAWGRAMDFFGKHL